MTFHSPAHKAFYEDCLQREGPEESQNNLKALFYTLGICPETRAHIDDLYDFTEHGVRPSGLNGPWQSEISKHLTLLAFGMYGLKLLFSACGSGLDYKYPPEVRPYVIEAVKSIHMKPSSETNKEESQ